MTAVYGCNSFHHVSTNGLDPDVSFMGPILGMPAKHAILWPKALTSSSLIYCVGDQDLDVVESIR